MMRVTALGWRADAALGASRGRACVVAALSRSLYAHAAGELIWIGEPRAALHPRAVLALDVPDAAVGTTLEVPAGGIPWRPAVPSLDPARVRAGARALHGALPVLGVARGLGRLLVAAGDDALMARARPHVAALAAACAIGDARGVASAGRALVGLGDGLTPSGDDYLGGALFAMRLVGGDAAVSDPAIAALLAEAATRTHPISARLLADLAAGDGWAPLHALVAALVGDPRDATDAARSVVAIGASSGWALLAGVLTALLGAGALAGAVPRDMATRASPARLSAP